MTLKAALLQEYIPPQTTLDQPFSFTATTEPSAHLIQKLTKEIKRLAELSMALYVRHARAELQIAHIPLKEKKVSERALNKYFRFYCPHLTAELTRMEIHLMMQGILDEHRPRFSKQEMQALHHIYQKWKEMPASTLTQKKNRALIERGLKVVMSSNVYNAALPKKRPHKNISRA